MTDKRWIPMMIIAILVILLVPYDKKYIEDGGTVVYEAIAYKVVKWNSITYIINDNGNPSDVSKEVYDETKVYFFGDRYKSLNELLDMELKEMSQDKED